MENQKVVTHEFDSRRDQDGVRWMVEHTIVTEEDGQVSDVTTDPQVFEDIHDASQWVNSQTDRAVRNGEKVVTSVFDWTGRVEQVS